MNVVTFICNHGRLGGDNLSMLGAIDGLFRRGVKSTVILPEHGPIVDELRNRGIKLLIIDFSIKGKTSKVSMFLILLRFFLFILVSKSDVLHSNDVLCNKYASICGKILKIPVVCHVRYHVSESQLAYHLSPSPNALIFNSKFMEKEFSISSTKLEFNGIKKVIYNPINEKNYYKPEYRKNVREEWKSSSKYIVAIIGNICKNKGHFDFIEIAKKLIHIKDDFIFIVIGKDITREQYNYKQIIENINNYNIKDHFIFHGVESDIGKVLSGIDLVVFPSHFESFGRVAIESLLAEVPIVASNIGGLVEILEGNPAARLNNVGDIDGFVKSVMDIRDSVSLDNSLILDGKNYVRDKFSFDKSVDDLLNLYESL